SDRISSEWEPSMGEITTIGLDLAKHVFQVHGVDAEGATVLRKQLRRAQVLAFFSRLPPCLIGLEACATAHYWARELRALGNEVRLMPAQYVKAYIKRNKHDAADAKAICEAVGRPTMRFVPVAARSIFSCQAGQFGVIQAVAPSLGIELRPIDTDDAREIEHAVVAFASEPNGGLIAATGGGVLKHRELIVALAARHRLPAIYAYRSHVMSGGLMSYCIDNLDQYRRAAGYVDRILRGEKPAELPVQAPTKYELAINLKTAKALGLTVPDSLLARADEVIE